MHLSLRILASSLLILFAGTTYAEIKLELSPSDYRFASGEGGGSTTASFDVNITGLPANHVVAAYDFGLIYDPSIMRIAGFGGFTDKLGDPTLLQVLNSDYTDLAWNYQSSNSGASGLGDYDGRRLGTPFLDASGDFYEGSLRFSQASLLCFDNTASGCPLFPGDPDLLTLQSPPTSFTLFSLTFNVDTTGYKVGTPVLFVTDEDYENFTSPPSSALLDFKIASNTDPNGENPEYPVRGSGSVRVPAPAPVFLVGLGVVLMVARRLYGTRTVTSPKA